MLPKAILLLVACGASPLVGCIGTETEKTGTADNRHLLPIPWELQYVRAHPELFGDTQPTSKGATAISENLSVLTGSFGRVANELVDVEVRAPDGAGRLSVTVEARISEVLIVDSEHATLLYYRVREYPEELPGLVSDDSPSFLSLRCDLLVVDDNTLHREIRSGDGGLVVGNASFVRTIIGALRVGLSVGNAWDTVVSMDDGVLTTNDGDVDATAVGVPNIPIWRAISADGPG